MRIAWIGKKSPFCGNVTYSREVTNSLLDRGHQVSFLHFAQEESEPDNWPNFQEVSLPFIYKSQVYTIPSFKATKLLTESLREIKPDLVHASLTLSTLDFLLPEICEQLNLPLIATFHTPFAGKGAKFISGTQLLAYQLYAPFLGHYDRVIVFSQIQRELLARMGVGEHNIAVIPNGVDTTKFSPGDSTIKAKFQAERLFVYQGRIAPEKNVESLLRAWKQSKMRTGSKLLIVGDGPLKSSLEAFYGLESGVVWLGFVAEEQRRIEILRNADVFILPSLVEGLSLSLLEAMACGIACLATDVGADGEVLEGGAGVILNTKTVRAQLRTLLPLFQDHPELTTLLGEKARQRVLERYTLTKNISQLEELYKEVLAQRRVPLSPIG
ncbi:glycosyltransferase family 4 protein [Umezakia ovalisporum]|jgi:glycosyltransferase involved in cell wall biosynthesis|uniref:Glycosyltransferase family 4 protein n=2 Tax=Umezakia ovalisporum TaxID=75695 RepID=A0AA43KDA9_9CYAN|nr:glycosyltransferase family 4 protein [Umezakia ovalisporum]MBI1241739.1 glycosyltransferase [Nostoc sp. RI_552]MDH6056570.1 glycosyltransferase family 4 protein [Umezakia ovalisporum FSS-43]MDH6062339.1 glycosyltransferase family 4 protein [Umezakia ovalisporum FSS-62]MDH6067936.1 glycosyltransferase family 4 protein [Umezakia ovalisporum APH033B]MDH6069230.1 glycosyltransferase family 4 protein [Umezakia ovalisporum CobakiLakeA]